MSEAALPARLMRLVMERPVMADMMEDGLDELIRRLGNDLPRAVVAAAVQQLVAAGLAYDPVRLPPGALQCHWLLELTPSGQQAARRA